MARYGQAFLAVTACVGVGLIGLALSAGMSQESREPGTRMRANAEGVVNQDTSDSERLIGRDTHTELVRAIPASVSAQTSVTLSVAGQYGGVSYAVATHGDHLYMGSGTELHILDVTDPASMTLLGSVELGAVPTSIDVHGDVVGVVDASSILHLVEAADIMNPVEVFSGVVPAERIHDVAVGAVAVYVAESLAWDEPSGVRVYDSEVLTNVVQSALLVEPRHSVHTVDYVDGLVVSGKWGDGAVGGIQVSEIVSQATAFEWSEVVLDGGVSAMASVTDTVFYARLDTEGEATAIGRLSLLEPGEPVVQAELSVAHSWGAPAIIEIDADEDEIVSVEVLQVPASVAREGSQYFVRVLDALSLTELGSMQLSDAPYDVAKLDNHMFVAQGDIGVVAIEIQ